MLPALSSGDLIATKKSRRLKIGDVVVVSVEGYDYVVKRIAALSDHSLVLKGDNPRTESSICGIPQSKEKVVGKLIFRLPLTRIMCLKAAGIFFVRRLNKWKMGLPYSA